MNDNLRAFRENMSQIGSVPGGQPVVFLDPMDNDPGRYENRDWVMVCEICGIALNRYTKGDEDVYIHGREWQRYDHDPVPKKIPKASYGDQLCDFCGLSRVLIWAFVGGRVRATSGNTVRDYGSTWGACVDCAPLVEARDLDALIDRVQQVGPISSKASPHERPYMMQNLREMLGPFLTSITHKDYIGPPIVPTRLDPRMMPKIHAGVIKWWQHPSLYERIAGKSWITQSLPGIHAGDPEQFRMPFHADERMPQQAFDLHAKHIIAGLRASNHELFWVSAEFTRLSMMAGLDFEHLTLRREDLPSPHGLLIWDMAVGEIERPYGVAAIRAASWTLVPGGIWINVYIQSDDADPEGDVTELREQYGYLLCPNPGAGIPFEVELDQEDDKKATVPRGENFVLTLLATWFLLAQPGVAEVNLGPVDTKLARSFKRANKMLPPVKLINLRRRPARPAAQSDHERRKLAYRRYTKGHWKRQFYGPKRGLRKMIYISPYISGDEHLPVRDKTPVVKVLR